MGVCTLCVLVVKFCECLWWRWGSVCVCVHMCVYTLCILVIWFCESATVGECVCVHILCAYIVCDWWLNFVNDSDGVGIVCVCVCVLECVYTLCVLVIWFCEFAPARVRVGCVCVCVHAVDSILVCIRCVWLWVLAAGVTSPCLYWWWSVVSEDEFQQSCVPHLCGCFLQFCINT